MSEPVRIQRKRSKGWKMPPNTVAVDRSTKWGNPYRAGIHCDQQHAVDSFRHLAYAHRPAKSAPYPDMDVMACLEAIRNDINELRGKNLACWCALDKPCHAEVLLELANRPLICEPATPENG